MRKLTFEEFKCLTVLQLKNSEDKLISCAISILLDDPTAETQLKELDEESQKQITDYPIYKLLKDYTEFRQNFS
jgi:hypothetical protein